VKSATCAWGAVRRRRFGDHGCLETVAGLQALAARVPRAWSRIRDVDLERRGRGGPWDPEARTAMLETARFIRIAAANVAAVVDPSLIVLGGALFAQAPRLVEAVSAVAQSIARAPLPVVLSALDKEAPLWGCLLIALTAAREGLRKELRG
jgi:predicted NBD/HSP70 family sugar kinase